MTPGTRRVTASSTTSAGTSPPASDVVADRELLGRQALDDALVDALVAPADQHQPGFHGELACEVLIQPPPGRRQQERSSDARTERLDREDRFVSLRVSTRGLRTIEKKGIEMVVAELRAKGVEV